MISLSISILHLYIRAYFRRRAQYETLERFTFQNVIVRINLFEFETNTPTLKLFTLNYNNETTTKFTLMPITKLRNVVSGILTLMTYHQVQMVTWFI